MNLKALKVRYRQFRRWQKRPYEVAPLSDVEHTCATCQTHYTGNYCPRCGQSARITRYSFKTALLHFFDVWGLGNRSMFRTIRDLMLRPGYMIRDYLNGMQMAYFPPFKLFFLLTALSVIVEHGLNIKGENMIELKRQETLANVDEGFSDAQEQEQLSEREREVETKMEQYYRKMMTGFYDTATSYPNIFGLLCLTVMSLPLFLLFRKSPNIRFRYSELFVSLVYSNNMYSVFIILINFFCLGERVQMIGMLLYLMPIKQLSGYSYLSTFFRFLLAFLAIMVLFIMLVALLVTLAYFFI